MGPDQPGTASLTLIPRILTRVPGSPVPSHEAKYNCGIDTHLLKSAENSQRGYAAKSVDGDAYF